MQAVHSSKELLTLDKTYLDDFVRFAQIQTHNGDLDAEYHVFKYCYKNMDTEHALWQSLLFVAYMHHGSMLRAYQEVPTPAELPESVWLLPMDTERRSFRGGNIRFHIASLVALYKQYGSSLECFLTQGFTSDTRKNWHILGNTLLRIWGNGRWAAFKTRELLYTSHDFPIEPSTIDNKGSSGPRQCLALFFPKVHGESPMAIDILDEQVSVLINTLRSFHIKTSYIEMETMLCNFHNIVVGNGYIGIVIDANLGQLTGKYSGTREPIIVPPEHPVWEARKAVFDSKYLGEIHGWDGMDKERKTLYKRTGKLLDRDE